VLTTPPRRAGYHFRICVGISFTKIITTYWLPCWGY